MSWHVDQDVLDRYQTGTADRVSAASIEAHVTSCAQCRSNVTVDPDWLDKSWRRIVDRVQPSEPTLVERVLCWVGVPQHLARMVSATPSLRPSWLIAVTLTLVFAGAASQMALPGSFNLFLALAPLAPVAGVAAAYGRLGDPAHEITAATPIDPLRLLLVRTGAVTGFAFVLSLVIDVAFSSGPRPASWVLPALALTLTALALGAHMRMWVAGATTAGAWIVLLTLFSTRPSRGWEAVFGTDSQMLFLAVALLAALVFVRDRDAYRRGAIQ